MEEPLDIMLKIMGARAYARAKRLFDEAQSKTDLPDDPMVDMVWAIQREIIAEKRLKRGRP